MKSRFLEPVLSAGKNKPELHLVHKRNAAIFQTNDNKPHLVLGLPGIFVPGYLSGTRTGSWFSGNKIATYPTMRPQPPSLPQLPLTNYFFISIE